MIDLLLGILARILELIFSFINDLNWRNCFGDFELWVTIALVLIKIPTENIHPNFLLKVLVFGWGYCSGFVLESI